MKSVQFLSIFVFLSWTVQLHSNLDESVAEVLTKRGQSGTPLVHDWLQLGRHSSLIKILAVTIYSDQKSQMKDIEEGLITGRGKKTAQVQKKRFEECELKIKTLRNKNNELQKQCDNELESDIRQAIKQQTSFIEHQIADLRTALESLARDFPDLGSKKKIREMCNVAGREMERNKRIMGEFINRASSYNSYFKRESTAQYTKSRTQFESDLPPNRDNRLQPVRESSSLIASEDMLSDIKAEQLMAAERTALIKQLQSKNNKINQIINEMGGLVGGEQKDMVDAIDDNIREVSHNVQNANEELVAANEEQKKAKKKYTCLVVTIIIIIIIAAGIVFFLVIK